jgi:hypothetical protein
MNESNVYDEVWVGKIGQSRLSAAVEAEEMNLFAILKPKLSKDGNQWCVLYGENLQEGIAGFGDTPRLAIYDFNKQWDIKA